MEIPYQKLSDEALRGLIEEYVTREGTDYGLRVYDLDEKVQHVMAQLKEGEVKIFYDKETQSANLVHVDDLTEFADEEEEAED